MTASRHPIVLITGFGPFPGQPQNASGLLAGRLAGLAGGRMPEYAFISATLPTEWRAGPSRLAELLAEHAPAIALHFGVSSRADGFVIETCARNVRASLLDACGEAPPEACVTADGPDTLACTLPTSEIAARLDALSLPTEVSSDAGDYLCNAILYHSLWEARSRCDARVSMRGFVHIPDALIADAPYAVNRGWRPAVPSRLNWDQAVTGGLAVLEACAGGNRDDVVPIPN
ncbi:MAG: pyroglutamyl-peptidase I [Hyphomicrobiaceae bacterium]